MHVECTWFINSVSVMKTWNASKQLPLITQKQIFVSAQFRSSNLPNFQICSGRLDFSLTCFRSYHRNNSTFTSRHIQNCHVLRQNNNISLFSRHKHYLKCIFIIQFICSSYYNTNKRTSPGQVTK